MITSNYRWRTRRILRWGLAISLLVHLLFGAIWIVTQPMLRDKTRHALALPTPPPNEIVTISNAPKIAQRNRVHAQNGHAAAPRPHPRVVAQVPQPQNPPVPVRPRVVPARPVVTPVPQRPARAHHEIAKLVPRSTPEPIKTVKLPKLADLVTAPPITPEPQTPQPKKAVASTTPETARPETARPETAPPQPEKKIAYQPRQQTATQTTPTTTRGLTQSQLAKINADLSKSIAQDRAENNPLNVRHYDQTPTSTRRYSFQLSGAESHEMGSQGLCSPIKSWQDGGWDYYYVSCNVAFSDGTTDVEAVPWPVRFRPSQDYFAADVPPPADKSLAGPLPGWTPPQGIYVGKGVKAYAKLFGYDL